MGGGGSQCPLKLCVPPSIASPTKGPVMGGGWSRSRPGSSAMGLRWWPCTAWGLHCKHLCFRAPPGRLADLGSGWGGGKPHREVAGKLRKGKVGFYGRVKKNNNPKKRILSLGKKKKVSETKFKLLWFFLCCNSSANHWHHLPPE